MGSTTRHDLDEREWSILQWDALGYSADQMARRLRVTRQRVHQLRKRARGKLQARVLAQMQAQERLDRRRLIEAEFHVQEAYLWLCRAYGRDVWRDDRDI